MSTVTFVLCIEQNAIRPQALLLIESIRRFTGALRNSEILAISPRGRGIDDVTRGVLRSHHVHYIEETLNRACPEYGSANRIYAGAWAEARCLSSFLIVLDSDTLFFGEPVLPGDHWDVGMRPMDLKGIGSNGPLDPMEKYWLFNEAEAGDALQKLTLLGTPADRISWLEKRVPLQTGRIPCP